MRNMYNYSSSWNGISLLFLSLGIAGFFSFTYYLLLISSSKTRKKLPPGPNGLPILGYLHKLGDLPHQTLSKLALKYGPIMHLKLGQVTGVVISSPEMAKLFLKTHDLVFASRPKLQSGEYLGHGQKGLAFAEYGSYWRNLRKFCTLHLLTNTKIESFKFLREEEVRSVIESIKVLTEADHYKNVEAAVHDEVVVNLSHKVESLAEDMTYRMVVGSVKDDEYNFKTPIQEVFRIVGAFNLADYVPFLAPLDLQGLCRQVKAVTKVLDNCFEKIIDQHEKDHHSRTTKQDNNNKYQGDFMDTMLSFMNSQDNNNNNSNLDLKLSRDHVKAILLDMIGAMMDTSATTVEWALSELIRNPRVMKRVQQELETVVGLDRLVEETDLMKLDYLEMVIKETMRLHPAAPLLIPRESMDDIKINGYDIPKKSRVFVNVWAIGRDPQSWSRNAEEFYPERFIGLEIDSKGLDFRLLPFGSGRRGCPGMQLGLTMVRLMLAQLVHCFDWELPNGMSPHELDMSEKFGLTVPRAKPLLAVPTYRLIN